MAARQNDPRQGSEFPVHSSPLFGDRCAKGIRPWQNRTYTKKLYQFLLLAGASVLVMPREDVGGRVVGDSGLDGTDVVEPVEMPAAVEKENHSNADGTSSDDYWTGFREREIKATRAV